jgi:hypothetical protein
MADNLARRREKTENKAMEETGPRARRTFARLALPIIQPHEGFERNSRWFSSWRDSGANFQ